MEWRIRETQGGYMAERGMYSDGGPVGYKPGYYMPCFVIYESAFCRTKEEAEDYIKKCAY